MIIMRDRTVQTTETDSKQGLDVLLSQCEPCAAELASDLEHCCLKLQIRPVSLFLITLDVIGWCIHVLLLSVYVSPRRTFVKDNSMS